MCLPHTIEQLRTIVRELDLSNKQLADTQQTLIQSEKLASMGQLAAGVAHEVNNPLGIVLMYAHLLLDEFPADSKHVADLEAIVEQADRCKRIVANLLNFARQNRVVLVPADLTDLVNTCAKALPPPEGVEQTIVHEMSDPLVEMDRDQVAQVLTNLISNAYAAMETTPGTLRLRTFETGRRVGFSVSDTGVGIPEENRHKIFEPFFTTKQMGRGTGLGLAVSYGIVKMHSGDICVESNADPAAGPTGTTITVKLPRQERARSQQGRTGDD
jgi:signal transduction histidine kinase